MLERIQSPRNSHSVLVGMPHGITATLEEFVVSYITNILSPYNPAIVLLGIYPKELKTYIYTKACTLRFIAAVLTLPKLGSNQDNLQQVNK